MDNLSNIVAAGETDSDDESDEVMEDAEGNTM